MEFGFLKGLFIFIAVLVGEVFGCMFGGGGFFIQPALLAAGVPAKMAVANDIAAAAFASVAFLLTTRTRSPQIVRTAAFIAPTLVIGAFVGGNVLKSIPAGFVEIMILLICTGGLVYILSHLKKRGDDAGGSAREPMARWRLALIISGIFLGFYDGISGAGGGIITIATLALIMRSGMKETISMANWVGAVSLSTAGITFFFLGLLDARLMALMVPAALAAGSIAARVSDAVPERILRLLYAMVLGALLVYLAMSLAGKHGLF